MSCEQCIKESQFGNRLNRLLLQNPSDHVTGSEDAMQIDLVTELPLSSGYQKIVTIMDVFSRYLFACPTTDQDAKTVAES